MKYIIAIIQPDRLDEVLDLLMKKDIQLVTVSNVVGRGRQKGISEVYRSHREAGTLLKKVKLEIAVNDEYVKPAMDAIVQGARTGQTGDGKIFIFDMQECLRIRTGETGPVAIG
ncbi:MAG: P-II family nitrogen regulator [bacterium]